MDDERFREEISNATKPPSESNRGLWAVVVILLCAVAISLAYAFREHNDAQQLATSQDQMSATLNQTRSQVDSLSAQLNDVGSKLAAAQAARETHEASPTSAEGTTVRRTVAHRRRVSRDDPRFKKMQAQLDDEQKQIATTQQNVDAARTELEGNLDSTRDELNGSIAKNHDELVALERRGQRNYFEFDLNKSKRFQHVGPMSLSLRKTSTKHDHFNMVMLVDDKEVSRKNVNLYEPMSFYTPDSASPLEVVVNQIGKDHVHGYISSPKYRKSELTSLSVDENGQAPAASGSTDNGSKAPASSTSGPTSSTASSPSSEADATLTDRPAPQF